MLFDALACPRAKHCLRAGKASKRVEALSSQQVSCNDAHCVRLARNPLGLNIIDLGLTL